MDIDEAPISREEEAGAVHFQTLAEIWEERKVKTEPEEVKRVYKEPKQYPEEIISIEDELDQLNRLENLSERKQAEKLVKESLTTRRSSQKQKKTK